MSKVVALFVAMLFTVTAFAKDMEAGEIRAEVYGGVIISTSKYNDYGGVPFEAGIDLGLGVFYNVTPNISVGGFFEAARVNNDSKTNWRGYQCGQNDHCEIDITAIGYMAGAAVAAHTPIAQNLSFFVQAKVGKGRVRSSIELTPFHVTQKVKGASEKATPFILEAGIRYYPHAESRSDYLYGGLRYYNFKGDGLTDISGASINFGYGF